MSTAVLDRPTEVVRRPALEYEVVPGRCVADLVVRVLGLTLMRVRLRPLSAGLRYSADGVGILWGAAKSSPAFTSVPGTRLVVRFLLRRHHRLGISSVAVPLLHRAGQRESVTADITGARQALSTQLDVRVAIVEDGRLVLALRARVRPFVFLDAAAEYVA